MKNIVAQTRYGAMCFAPTDKWIGESLLAYGEYARDEVDFIRANVPKDGVALDIGANIGAITLPMAKMFCEVVAYEPQRLPFQLLCANLALNSISNVLARQAIVGHFGDTIDVPVVGWTLAGRNSGGFEVGGDPGEAEIFDNDKLPVLTANSNGPVSFIKIDVEGDEHKVITGAHNLIKRDRPVIQFEADREVATIASQILLRQYGYKMAWHLTPLYSPNNWAGESRNLFGNIISINIMAWHPDRPLACEFDPRLFVPDGKTESFQDFKSRLE